MVASKVAPAAVLAFLAGSALARNCQNITIPVQISSRNAVFGNLNIPVDDLGATLFALNITRQGGNASADFLTGYATISGTYDLMATYCQPAGASTNAANGATLQIMTHGIGFDRNYWDLAYDNYTYSYVDVALEHGYHTLTYDRLGLGQSYHAKTTVQTRDEIQSFLEVEALAKLTRMLRNGNVDCISTKFKKIIHVGHSFGSAQSYALTAKYPGISDGIVLTGFSTNGSYVALFGAGANFQQANTNQPLRFGSSADLAAINMFTNAYGLTDLITPLDVTALQPLNYVSGYLTNANAYSGAYLFLFPPHFDPSIGYYAEQTKQPVTTGELLTLGSLPMSSTFAGPVLIFTGSNDLPYCGGDCLATGGAYPSIPAAAASAFTKAKKFEAYIQPVTGHGLNFHYNASSGYEYIQSWLANSGLGA